MHTHTSTTSKELAFLQLPAKQHSPDNSFLGICFPSPSPPYPWKDPGEPSPSLAPALAAAVSSATSSGPKPSAADGPPSGKHCPWQWGWQKGGVTEGRGVKAGRAQEAATAPTISVSSLLNPVACNQNHLTMWPLPRQLGRPPSPAMGRREVFFPTLPGNICKAPFSPGPEQVEDSFPP